MLVPTIIKDALATAKQTVEAELANTLQNIYRLTGKYHVHTDCSSITHVLYTCSCSPLCDWLTTSSSKHPQPSADEVCSYKFETTRNISKSDNGMLSITPPCNRYNVQLPVREIF